MKHKGKCPNGSPNCYRCTALGPMPRPLRFLGDEECREVVLPKLAKTHNELLATLQREAVERTFPTREDAAKRYLKAIGKGRCCSYAAPCANHKGALWGRDWRTGEVAQEATWGRRG